jgi:beta-glucosidase-like glycosyl hydrolase
VNGSFAALLIPELRWDPGVGFSHLQEMIDDALELGVGGFVVRGGSTEDVAALTGELHRRSRLPLLIAADAERGAGGAFRGATGLPPFAALAALRDEEAIRRAARLTARELRALGVTWALAPVADLAAELSNPMLGARTAGADAQRVAEWCVAWVDACQNEGVLACAAHFPGVGRARTDPANEYTEVGAAGAALWSADLVPFRAVVDAGVATVLAAQVSYPRLDASGELAARSPLLLRDLLRGELQYEGLIVSDAPSQRGAAISGGEGQGAAAALVAGCDLILAPADLDAVLDGIERALRAGTLPDAALEERLRRRTFWAQWGRPGDGRDPTLEDVLWARQTADTVVHALRGALPNVGTAVDVYLVDDDAEFVPGAVDRLAGLFETLRAMEITPRQLATPGEMGSGLLLIAVMGAPAAGRGRAGYTEATRRQVAEAVAVARQARRPVAAVIFGPPALAAELPEVPQVVCAWSGDRAMQEAVARRLG